MRLRIVDAFTDRPFTGNPAGVVLLGDADWDVAWMRQVAAEVNLSETAFCRPSPDSDSDFELRWFTPAAEVAMCGHATLATAHVLFADGWGEQPVRFSTLSGVLTAQPEPDGSTTMNFPAAPLTSVTVPEGLAEALGAQLLSVHDTGPQVGDLLVELADEAAVHALAPDNRALARHSERGVIATAAARSADDGYDFVSRCFFPRVGIDEDPVTGSAHTALAPFWSARLGRTELTGLQASSRPGRVRTRLDGDRVLLGGRAVTVIDGRLLAH